LCKPIGWRWSEIGATCWCCAWLGGKAPGNEALTDMRACCVTAELMGNMVMIRAGNCKCPTKLEAANWDKVVVGHRPEEPRRR